MGRFSVALPWYWRAHALYRRCGVQTERMRALLGASACLRILGRYAQARKMWYAVAHSKWGKDIFPAEVLLEHALVERGLGHHREAGRMLRRCVKDFAQARDLEPLRHSWWALAGVERFSGRFRPALAAFRKAEALARRLKDPTSQAYALCGQAACHRILGERGPAFSQYRQAHGIFVRLKDRFGEAYGLCGMANALRVYGDAHRCVPLYKKSAKIYREVGDEGSRAFALWGLGGTYLRLHKLHEARVHYRSSLLTFRRVNDERGVVMALLGESRVLAAAAKPRQALALADWTAQLARRNGLAYEAALARFEASRISSTVKPKFDILRPFQIPPKTIQSWRDVP